MLLLCEGLAGALKIMGTLWRKACFASINILVDNFLMILERVGRPVVLLVVFNTLDGGGYLTAILMWLWLGTLVWRLLDLRRSYGFGQPLLGPGSSARSPIRSRPHHSTVKNAVWALQVSVGEWLLGTSAWSCR